jgi:hypothetical protein
MPKNTPNPARASMTSLPVRPISTSGKNHNVAGNSRIVLQKIKAIIDKY